MSTELSDEPIRIGRAHGWTATGIECHELEQDCNNCIIKKIMGFSKGNGCFQWQANDMLIAEGINPPALVKEGTGRYITPGPRQIHRPINRKISEELRREIAIIIKETGGATYNEVIEELNRREFKQQKWRYEIVTNHMHTMRAMGVIYSIGQRQTKRKKYLLTN